MVNVTHGKLRQGERWPWLFGGIRPVTRTGAVRDALAGITLAAMNVPQALGYARIAGMPVVTGLYTLLLPLAAFAALGSSRYLVVAADSATAAILAGRLSQIAPIASAHYVALAGLVALLTAGCLLLARLFKLGFLADFLSQTLLVGFLTGVGFQVGIAMLGEMLGVTVSSDRTVEQLAQIVRGMPQLHVPTLCVAGAVLTIVFVFNRFAPSLPASLFAVVGSIAASAAFDFSGHGIALIQRVTGGLLLIGLPDASWREIPQLLPVSASCFLMIVTQSAATARAYASRDNQKHDENTDLVGLSPANAAAAFSGTFVVNGSPTQTAMVEMLWRAQPDSSDRHGRRRGPRAPLPDRSVALFILWCVLGAIVFTIAVGLIDVRSLRDIRRESPGEFWLALITAATVVVIGVEQGILLAIGLSLLWGDAPQLSTAYRRARRAERTMGADAAVPGAFSGPGLVIFQLGQTSSMRMSAGLWPMCAPSLKELTRR